MSEPITCIRKPSPMDGDWRAYKSELRAGGTVAVGPIGTGTTVALVFDDAALPLIAAAPDLLAFARRALPMLIAERDCLYDGCSVPATGEVPDEDDREVIAMIDREIDELRALIARAEGSA